MELIEREKIVKDAEREIEAMRMVGANSMATGAEHILEIVDMAQTIEKNIEAHKHKEGENLFLEWLILNDTNNLKEYLEVKMKVAEELGKKDVVEALKEVYNFVNVSAEEGYRYG